MILWSEDDDKKLEEFWAAGLSATQISLKFSGRSRNAIIGRVHRLGLPGRLCSRTRSARKTKKAKDTLFLPPPPVSVALTPPALPILKKLVTEMKQAIKEDEPQEGGIGIMDLEPKHCRFIISQDNETARFCGAPKEHGVSYCGPHASRCFQAAQPYRGGRRKEKFNMFDEEAA